MSDDETSAERPQPGQDQKSSPRGPRTPVRLFLAVIGFVVVAALLLVGWLPRRQRTQEVNAKAEEQKTALPIVQVMTVHKASAAEQLTLPGTVTPVTVAHIYARAAGYVKKRYVDLGDKVHAGQLLALISTPDLDAIVLQNQALLQEGKDALSKAQSQLQLQQVTYDRVHTLVQHGVLSQQDDDTYLAAVRSAAADVSSSQNAIKAAEATLAHASALASFEEVRSPVDGTITARNVETGSLVSPGGQAQAFLRQLHRRRRVDLRPAGRKAASYLKSPICVSYMSLCPCRSRTRCMCKQGTPLNYRSPNFLENVLPERSRAATTRSARIPAASFWK